MSRAANLLGSVAVVMLFVSITVGSASSLTLSSQNLTPYRTCLLSGTPTTTITVTDATVRQAYTTTNYGTATTNDVASASSANRRLFIRFDLAACSPAIPSTATVRLATLRMYASALPAACRTLDVFRVTATWTETSITWSNQPFGTTLNNPPSASRTTSFNIGTPVGCQYGAIGFTAATVTADVAAWVSGSATNFGWMLRDDVEGSSTVRTATFSAKNLSTPAQVPELVISYVTVP